MLPANNVKNTTLRASTCRLSTSKLNKLDLKIAEMANLSSELELFEKCLDRLG